MTETTAAKTAGPAADATKPKIELQDEIVETEHVARIGGGDVAYRATTGRIVMKDEEGKAKASIFFIAYTRS
jgi:carboxypeptidase C (cathepsin A)